MLKYSVKIDNFAWPVFVIYLLTKAFAGPLGIIFPLIRFIPVVMMLALISYKLVVLISVSMRTIIMCAVILLYIVIGVYYKSLFAALFGFYMFIPLLFSILFANELIDKIINVSSYKFALFLFVTCSIGVIYVDAFGAPWIGFEQEFAGVTKSVSKEWSSDGIVRNPGFTSGSVSSAAIMLMVTAQLGRYYSSRNHYLIFFGLFAIAFYIINLTTSKTMMISLALVLVFLCLPSYLMRWGVKILALITVSLSYFYMFGDRPLGVLQYDNTLLVRMYSTWPNAIGILDSNIAMMFGKGFGSIGTPSYMFLSKIANPADNLYVYLYVIFGFLSVILVGMLLFKVLVKRSFYTLDDKLFYVFVFIAYSGAVTYNVVEASIYATYGGVIAGYVLLGRDKDKIA